VRITSLGHAGLLLSTAGGTILCDPWFNPAYFGSWFPFPANDQLDTIDPALMEQVRNPDYLYLSHLHLDHFDEGFLRDHLGKGATVLLPDFPLPHLENSLRELGFQKFVTTRSGEPVELDRLRIMIISLTAPTDGPIGDSCLAVDDGTATFLNQNDARPPDLEPLIRFGPYDGHALQFSGAIWYPMVYDLPTRAKEALGRQKRNNGMDRAQRYVEAVGARHVFPNSGPPAFLDTDLFALNDLTTADLDAGTTPDSPSSFPDQTVFLAHLAAHDIKGGELLVTASSAELDRDGCRVEHRVDPATIFGDKSAYLRAYQVRMRPVLAAEHASWAVGDTPLLPVLAEQWEPLLAAAPHLCAGVGDRVLLETERERIVVDFVAQRVVEDDGTKCRFQYRIADTLLRTHLRDGREDWVNGLFLSCRFTATRIGPYNDFVYMFFKCLSPDRIAYMEAWLGRPREITEFWRFGDHMVQRRCPHMGADLSRFGKADGDTLTCELHGWQFDLTSGRCLTSDDVHLVTKPVTSDAP
jgi:UDP-MurNAc hydroxylase